MKKLTLVFAGCLMLTSSVHGQPQAGHPMADNTAKIAVSIKMDRDVYFPGELYQATIEVTNPTSAPLLVEAPFQEYGCVSVERKAGDKLIPTQDPRMGGGCRDHGPAPTITLGPGERRQAVLDVFGFNGTGWPSVTAGSGMLFDPGDYVLRYDYGGGAQAPFAIVVPKLEADAVARVRDEMYSDRPDRRDPHPIPAYVQVIAFRWQDESYICVSQNSINDLWRPKPSEPSLLGLGSFKRVATSQDPVSKLSATADADENLTIEWKTSSGRQERFYYAASYVMRDARERAYKLMIEELNKDD